MRSWKALLGIGAACVACCAGPLLGGTAAWAAGSTALAALGAAVVACADEFALLGGVLLVLAAGAGALVWWRRRAKRLAEAQCECADACEAPPGRTHGCAPGAAGG